VRLEIWKTADQMVIDTFGMKCAIFVLGRQTQYSTKTFAAEYLVNDSGLGRDCYRKALFILYTYTRDRFFDSSVGVRRSNFLKSASWGSFWPL
jgi:hypothetical protein